MAFTEWLGAVTGLLCVWLLARQHVLSWPIGILNNAVFLRLFWTSKLYADALLQVVFASLGVYGWWLWTRQRTAADGPARVGMRVRTTRSDEWRALAGVSALVAVLCAALLARYTDSPAPFWDAGVLSLSLAATYGQAKKLLESWYLWIAVDLIAIPLYLWRSLYPTALLYALFLGLCVSGLRSWRRELAEAPVVPERAA